MTVMARTLAIMAAYWLSLPSWAGAAAEPPPASDDTTSESTEAQVEIADSPAATTGPAVVSDSPPSASATEVEAGTDAGKVQPVKEVTLDPTVKPPVCRRYVPTGSRIATEVCQSAEIADAVRAAERDQTRRDIDEMRMRQATRDAARAAAQAESLRRSMGF
jgi:hypothetical protein